MLLTDANGTVSVNMPNAVDGVSATFTFASLNGFRGFLLLHEMGHQAEMIRGGGNFPSDKDPTQNGKNSKLVLDNCFQKINGVYQ